MGCILDFLSAARDTFLATGSRYRVVQPFLGYEAGEEVDLVARPYDPHNAAQTWMFLGVTDRRAAELSELADAHAPFLRELERYLVLVPV